VGNFIWIISKLVDPQFNEKSAKGSEGKKDCAASIGGYSLSHRPPSSLPQSSAEAGKQGPGEITEYSAPGKKRALPHDCKQDDFSSGPMESLFFPNRPALWTLTILEIILLFFNVGGKNLIWP
jgi:hypothetical protein